MTGTSNEVLAWLSELETFSTKLHIEVGMYGLGFGTTKSAFLSIPVPPITPENQSLVSQIESLVDQILARKRGNPPADTRDLERAIDDLVYRLYDLTPDEIRLVEGG
jgi:hypothetical protein